MDDHADGNQDIFASIGASSRAWNFHSHNNQRVFDLAHDGSTSDQSATEPHLKIKASNGAHINISVPRSALVIVDMQNYFLSSALGRPQGSGHNACFALIRNAIPAARKAGIQIIWLNWGLTDEDMETMPPAVSRCFGFNSRTDENSQQSVLLDKHGNPSQSRTNTGLGLNMGKVSIPESEGGPKEVEAGQLLYRDTWNAELWAPLQQHYAPQDGDAWIHKNRMSGMWGSGSRLQSYLEEKKITTLFFAGVNTDQCVGGTLTDAFNNGYNCIMLTDGCGTTSPKSAQEAWEFNCTNTYGFVTTCRDLMQEVQ